jgi:hypothetical protein
MAMAPLPFDGDGAVLRWSFGTEQALSIIGKTSLSLYFSTIRSLNNSKFRDTFIISTIQRTILLLLSKRVYIF